MTKVVVRQQIRGVLQQLDDTTRQIADAHIVAHLQSLYRQCFPSCIAVFAPLSDEPQLWQFIEWVWHEYPDCLVTFPCVDASTPTLAAVHSRAQLVPSLQSVYSPDQECPVIDPKQVQWMLVPARAVDVHGYRLGRGGGYYDRLLSRIGRDCVTMAVVYRVQCVSQVPHVQHDRRVERVCSERGVYLSHE